MNLIPLFVIAGLATTAAAQRTMTLNWTVSDTGNGDGTLEPGEQGIATLWALMDPEEIGFAESYYSFSHDDAGAAYSFDNLLDAETDDGNDLGNGTVIDIESFQLPLFFNPDFDASNPIALATFTITPNGYTPRTITFGTYDHISFDVYIDEFGITYAYDGVVHDGEFLVIPSPAGALLLLGGLALTRKHARV